MMKTVNNKKSLKLKIFLIAFCVYFLGVMINWWFGGCMSDNPLPFDHLKCSIENSLGFGLFPLSIVWYLIYAFAAGTFDIGFFFIYSFIGFIHIIFYSLILLVIYIISQRVAPRKNSNKIKK